MAEHPDSLSRTFNEKSRTVLLFGGSFNPPHDGHFETAAFLNAQIHPDELWMMFSVSPLKDPGAYAPLEDRMEMGRILAAHYPDLPIVITDIEERLGIHYTYFLLKALQAQYPDTQFIWAMGADGLAQLDRWMEGEKLIREFPLVIIDRPPFTQAALATPLAVKYADLRCADMEDFLRRKKGWVLASDSDLTRKFMHSHLLRQEIAAGKTDFPGHFNEAASYARDRGLYGSPPPAPSPSP